MVFPAFTVRENLLIGGVNRLEQGRPKEEVEAEMQGSTGDFQDVSPLGGRIINIWVEPQRRRAANARHRESLMARPRLLLLDEPSLGLAPFRSRKSSPSSRLSENRELRSC